MAKYIDAEKLKEEIARQIKALLPSEWIGTPAAVRAYSEVLAYIDTLGGLDVELIKRSWYMEGYNDCKFEQDPLWIISTGPDGPQYKLNPNREGGGSK